jgi:hypothetical protein
VARARANWKRIVPFALTCVCVVAAVRKLADQEYIHASIAGVLALFNLILGLKGVTQVSEPLSGSMSEISDFLAGGQDGTDL